MRIAETKARGANSGSRKRSRSLMLDEGGGQQREKHWGRSLGTSDTEVRSPALALGGGRGGVRGWPVKSWTVWQTWTHGREGNKSMNPTFQDGKIDGQVFQSAFCCCDSKENADHDQPREERVYFSLHFPMTAASAGT